ncbi:MAG TPA: BBE domain-containing protein [Streptosporangiaceae bacterium]|nr:BBE domain-containing protein [Streptosporangiaceae bacterium]
MVSRGNRGNNQRLAQVKRRYDPRHHVPVNQNIQPAASPGATH